MSLFIVSTPIGNMSDITFRAIEVLKNADLILAEDTRKTKRLLSHYDITTALRSYHDFNKEKITPGLIEKIAQGEQLALVTDAGTPGVADPAFFLVRAALNEGLEVTPVPGASAFLTALVASGLPSDRFIFENFLPPKSARRRRLFESLRDEPRTVIFYESPHRIIKTLRDIKEVLDDVLVVVGRELTKIHEEFLRDSAENLLFHFEKKPPRGEMVVLFNVRVRKGSNEGRVSGGGS